MHCSCATIGYVDRQNAWNSYWHGYEVLLLRFTANGRNDHDRPWPDLATAEALPIVTPGFVPWDDWFVCFAQDELDANGDIVYIRDERNGDGKKITVTLSQTLYDPTTHQPPATGSNYSVRRILSVELESPYGWARWEWSDGAKKLVRRDGKLLAAGKTTIKGCFWPLIELNISVRVYDGQAAQQAAKFTFALAGTGGGPCLNCADVDFTYGPSSNSASQYDSLVDGWVLGKVFSFHDVGPPTRNLGCQITFFGGFTNDPYDSTGPECPTYCPESAMQAYARVDAATVCTVVFVFDMRVERDIFSSDWSGAMWLQRPGDILAGGTNNCSTLPTITLTEAP